MKAYIFALFLLGGAVQVRSNTFACNDLNRFPAKQGEGCGECYDAFVSQGRPGGKCVFSADPQIASAQDSQISTQKIIPTFEMIRGSSGNPFAQINLDGEDLPEKSFYQIYPSFGDLFGQNYDDAFLTVGEFWQKRECLMFKNDGEGTLRLERTDNPFKDFHVRSAISFADLNNDSHTDAVFVEQQNDNQLSITILSNDGKGNLKPMESEDGSDLIQGLERDHTVRGIGFVDADEDGDLDLVAFEVRAQRPLFFENVGTVVSPKFVQQTELDRNPFANVNTYGAYMHPFFEDIDQDGRTDLFLGSEDGKVYFYKNHGNGLFKQMLQDANPFGHLLSCLQTGKSLSEPFCKAFIAFGKLRKNDMERDAYIGRHGTYGSFLVDRFKPVGLKGHTNFWKLDSSSSLFAEVNRYIDTYIRKQTLRVPRTSVVVWPTDTDPVVQEVFIGLDDGSVHRFALEKEADQVFTPVGQVPELSQSNSDNTWATLAVDPEERILYVGSSSTDSTKGHFSAYRRLADGSFTKLQEQENPLRNIQELADRHNVIFANVSGTGLYACIPHTVKRQLIVRCFPKGQDGTFLTLKQAGKQSTLEIPLGALIESSDWASLAFMDADNDGDLDLFIGSEAGRIHFAFNNGPASDPTFTFTNGVENPFNTTDFDSYVFPHVTDLDGDGDLDLIVGVQGGRVVQFSNTALECSTGCTMGRGACASSNIDAFSTDVLRQLTPSFRNGGCFCEAPFTGVACERCAKGRIGENCESFCPRFSTTRGDEELIALGFRGSFPVITTEEDCVCDATFVADPAASPGKLECVCPPGWSFNTEFSVCQECKIGTYKTDASLLQCTQCGAETHSAMFFTTSITGATTKEDCVCKQSFVLFQDECTCPPGWRFDSAASICEPCPKGTFKEEHGREECIPCGSSLSTTAQNGTNSRDSCTCKSPSVLFNGACVCPPGTGFQNDVCASCEPGSFSSTYDLSECLACPEGLTTFLSGMASCESVTCPLGQERDPKTLRCQPCQKGWFRDDMNTIACQECPPDRTLTIGNGTISKDGCISQAGSFLLSSEVVSCNDPEFAGKVQCESPGLTLETLCLQQGWWRISTTSTDIRRCPVKSYCEGKVVGCSSGRELSTEKESDPYCTEHHHGVLCMQCDDNYAISSAGKCERCTDREAHDRGVFIVLCVFAIVLVFAPAFVLLFTLRLDHNSSEESGGWFQYLADMVSTLGTGMVIFIGFLQVFWQFVQQNALLYSENVGGILSVALNLDLSSMFSVLYFGCYVKINFYDKLLAATLWPILSSVILAMASVLLRRWHGTRAFSTAVWVLFQMLFLIYPRLSTIILSTFVYDKFDFGDGRTPFRALKADYVVNYDDDASKIWRVYAGVMTALYVVGVLLLFLFSAIWSARQPNRNPITFLIQRYEKETPWYESVDLLRKLVLTGCFVLVSQESQEAGNLFFVAFCSLGLFLFYRLDPYHNSLDSRFAEVTMLLLFALSYIPLAFPDDHDTTSALVYLVFALELTCFVVHFVLRFRSSHGDREKQDSPAVEQKDEESAYSDDHSAGTLDVADSEPDENGVGEATDTNGKMLTQV